MNINKNIILINNFSYEEFLKIKEYLLSIFEHDFILDFFPDDQNITLSQSIKESIEEASFFPMEQRLDYFLKTSDFNKESFIFIYLKNSKNLLNIIKNFPFKNEKKIIFFTLTDKNGTLKIKDLFNHLIDEYRKANNNN
ncbi:MAG: hypothetical protein N3A58_05960 [Spirochaetes bacterium]|nr:hypothetical protein [Spirochaetota bacterium]